MAERGRPLASGSDALLGLAELNRRFTALQKEFAELRDQLNVFENWNSEIKKMYGKQVYITTPDSPINGVLVWSDRYNLCIERGTTGRPHRVIICKGGMISIELVE